jgi:hypothetical protein
VAVVINEIVSEVVLSGPAGERAAEGAPSGDDRMDEVVRRAAERVLEHLRREWDR